MLNLKINQDIINKYINYFLIGYAFCLPISKAGTNLFEILILLLWLFGGNWQYKFNHYKNNPLIVIFAVFIGFSMISIFWANNYSYGLEYVAKYRHFLLIPAIYTSLNKDYIKHILSAFLFGMLASEIMSYGIFFELWHYKNISHTDPSPFMSHTDYSVYLTFTAMILLNRVFFTNNFKHKILYSFFFVTVVSNLFINGGRTGQVTFIIVITILLLLNIKNKLKGFLISFILIFSIFTTAYSISPNFNNRANLFINDMNQMINKNVYKGSLSTRISLWIVGFDKFADNILIGTGFGNEMSDIKMYAQKRNFDPIHLTGYGDHHNLFITSSIQLGILGLILIFLIFYSLIKLQFKSIIYKNINIVFVVAFIMWSFGGLTFHLMNAMVFFSFFAGLFNKISSLEKES